MKRLINKVSRKLYQRSFGLLLIRVALGLLFLLHGWMKLGALDHTVGMFAGMGFPVFVAYFISWLEFLGGIALILGVAARFFAALFGIEMFVAALLVGFGRGVPIELTLALVCFGVAFAGAGAYAVFKMECQQCGGMLCDGKSCELD